MDTDLYRVEPGTNVRLAEMDTRDRRLAADGKKAARGTFRKLNERLERLQELLYAEGKHGVLIVLQAMDAGGKDGTIRHVFDRTNPQGVRVTSFKKPTSRELAHDYLWRVHQHTPSRGQIAIFNRSHYEDVLVVRVRELVRESVWAKRYDHIKAFERRLADEGTTIIKFFLHISKDEQKERFQSRLDERHKRWKFNAGDLEERKLWDEYMRAYEAALSRTSTPWAPWYIIPADRKWYRNLVISHVLVETLERLNMKFPEPEDDLDGIAID